VLGQLFAVTELFDMQTRPELILLQKNMVLVEGVARALDPELDIWTIAEPVVGDWLRREEGPVGRIEELREGMTTLVETVKRLPGLVARAETALDDYDAEKAARRPWISRDMVLIAWWVVVLMGLLLIWRLIT
jgi:ubiquinone biosynthesis protein